jgi:DNA-binding protein HU-beta
MNKAELVTEVAKVTVTKKDAEAALNAVFAAITRSLKNGEPVTVIGFGTFAVKKRAARVGRNPKSGEPVNLPEKNVPVFRPGRILKNELN